MAHLGIRVTALHEEEYCLIPMGGVLPRVPQRVLGIGGTAGMVHPSTGECLEPSSPLVTYQNVQHKPEADWFGSLQHEKLGYDPILYGACACCKLHSLHAGHY